MNTTYGYTGAPDECSTHWPAKPTECAEQHHTDMEYEQHIASWHYTRARLACRRGKLRLATHYQQIAATQANEARRVYQFYYPTKLATNTVLAMWSSKHGRYKVEVIRTAEGGHIRSESERSFSHGMQYTPPGFMSDESAIESGVAAANWQPSTMHRLF